MARNMADDYQETYRARIVWKWRKQDDEGEFGSRWGTKFSNDPDAPERVTFYGPYSKPGAAKAQFSQHRHNWREGAIEIVSAKVQKASITWEDVDD